jgi:cytochrome c peroxidase
MKIKQFLGLFLSMFLFLIACKNKSQREGSNAIKNQDVESVLAALPAHASAPSTNPYTEEKAELGRLLFYDPILSGNKDVACASCHHPDFGYAESLEISIGVNGHGLGSKRVFNYPNDIPLVKRNSQTILNTAFNGIDETLNYDPDNAPMFWDLRAKSLESQSLEPIKTLEEMRGRKFQEHEILTVIIERLRQNKTYEHLFQKVFGGNNAVTKENIAKALATFERKLIAPDSRFDQFMKGDKTAMSENELEGMKAFLKSGCAKCHRGAMFTDFKTHNLGVIDHEGLGFFDDGFRGKSEFRTPSLRNLRFTSPYMHNGKLKTLENVLEFYEDLSGNKIQNTRISADKIDPLIKENLKVEFKDIRLIVEFLNTLNDDNFDKTIPRTVPSGLKVGGEIY